MIQNENILEYIDGQLDSESEQELFDAMAHQPELRSVLRQYISIGEAVRADREAFTPPSDVERSLMTGIGITARDLGLATGSIGLLARLGAAIGGRLWGAVDAFVLGALLSAILLSFVGGSPEEVAGRTTDPTVSAVSMPAGADPRGGGSSTGASPAVVQGTNGTPTGGRAGASMPLAVAQPSSSGSSSLAATSNATAPATSTVQRPVNVRSNVGAVTSTSARTPSMHARRSTQGSFSSPTRTPVVRNNAGGTTTASEASNVTTVPPSTTAAEPDRRVIPHEAMIPVAPRQARAIASGRTADRLLEQSLTDGVREVLGRPSPIDMKPEEEHEPTAFAELRGQLGWSTITSNARSASSSVRQAMAAGVYMQMGPSVACGLEAGSESYDQTLRYRSGDTLQIDQRPTYLWGGLGVRYSMGSVLFADLQPFLQATLGGTQVGPVFRFRAGTQYDIAGGLGANLSGEFSSLMYAFDGQRMMSGRWGLTIGATYSFK